MSILLSRVSLLVLPVFNLSFILLAVQYRVQARKVGGNSSNDDGRSCCLSWVRKKRDKSGRHRRRRRGCCCGCCCCYCLLHTISRDGKTTLTQTKIDDDAHGRNASLHTATTRSVFVDACTAFPYCTTPRGAKGVTYRNITFHTTTYHTISCLGLGLGIPMLPRSRH